MPFEQAPMGTTGLETAFAALYTGLVLPGVLELGLLVERMTAGAALFELPTPTIAKGEPANLTLVDLDGEWIAGEHGWESRSENCCFAGRRLQGRVLLTVAAGAVVYRERAFSVVAADLDAWPDGLCSMRDTRGARRRRRAGGRSGHMRPSRASPKLREARAGGADPRRAARGQRAVPEGPRPHRAGGRPGGGDGRSRRACSRPPARRASTSAGRDQALVCGIETHVCVSQTVHDLLERGVEVQVPADAVGSRHGIDYERGLERLERAGAVVTTVEAALFELLERAGTPEFKAVQKLILMR